MTILAFLGQKLMLFKRTQEINKLILRSCEIYKRTQDGNVPGDISKMMPSTKQLKLCLRGIHLDASQAIRHKAAQRWHFLSGLSCISLWGLPAPRPGSTNVRKLIPSFASTLRRSVMLPSTCIIRKEQQKKQQRNDNKQDTLWRLRYADWKKDGSSICRYMR